MIPVALLAGGLATRLKPITETIPKALVEVAGKSFIDWQLEDFTRQGIRKVIICTGHLGEKIQEHVGDGSRYELEVIYSHDGPELRGTGGALKNALPHLPENFFVVYGDSFLPVDYGRIERAFYASDKIGLMTIIENGDLWEKSNVQYTNGRLIEYNKNLPRPDMRYVDYGISVLSSKTLREQESSDYFDLADLYHNLSIQDLLAGYLVYNRFYEIGSHAGLKETEQFLISKDQ